MGAYDVVTQETITITNTTYITAQEIVEMLKLLREKNQDKEVVIILDNARYQKCKLVKKACEDYNITIEYLPSYSPNLNLIERLWKWLRSKCLSNKYRESFSEFCDEIKDYLSKTSTVFRDEIASMLAPNFQTLGHQPLQFYHATSIKDEISYNLLRNRLKDVNITFKCANAYYLSQEFRGRYDFILLSNILDYFSKVWKIDWNYSRLQEYEESLEQITSDKGIVFLKYIYNYGIGDRIMKKNSIIGCSSVKVSDLTIEEIHRLPSVGNKKTFDGMILTKKR